MVVTLKDSELLQGLDGYRIVKFAWDNCHLKFVIEPRLPLATPSRKCNSNVPT